MVGYLEARIGFGDVAQVFQYQPVQRLRSIERKLKSKLAIEFSQQRTAFDQVTAIGLPGLAAGLQR